MYEPCLKDKDEYPDDHVLRQHLGDVKETWDSFQNFLSENYPAFSGEWRYYNDGKSWLYKLTKKKKTICWISVYPNKFMTTFYFSDKAEDLIRSSKLRKTYIEQFINGKRYGKIRGIRVDVKKPVDLNSTKKLIQIKEQLK